MYVSHNSDEDFKKKQYTDPGDAPPPRQKQPPPPSQYRLKDQPRNNNTTTTSMVPSVWLWLADDESWERFDEQETSVIMTAVGKGHKGAILQRGSVAYFLDLLRLTQTNAVTGRRRPIYSVQKGANWLVQSESSPKGDGWIPFTHKETLQLEEAFFAGSDFSVVNRDNGSACYVDLAKWTLTCLSTNATCFIKITPNTAAANDQTQQSSAAKSQQQQQHYKDQHYKSSQPQQQQQHYKDQHYKTDRSTSSSPAEDDYDASYYGQQQIIVNNSDNSNRKNRASWRWHNDSHSWTSYNDEITDAIEQAWATGANDLVFVHENTQYYVDLANLTQTNIDTGYTRPIQRVSQRKKSSVY
ncbi:expressed unknown protein [Seminavis robusta]|uniref:WWE domain-containing protein n=1 Tax=Seminavis robusta TaxID=568900 RepID=A0A9N8HGJ4_9STRA|nr:expressed unknown protein [Seminavis robusta]|eukprot:Sro487_g152940.1 n/a (355) ;mRNA; f:51302-52366